MKKLRILIAEDHEIVRSGIKLLIEEQSDMEVVGEAGDGEKVIELMQELTPDIVILDISMPRINGLKAAKHIKENFSGVRILILTRHTESGYVHQFIEIGVSGYVLKQSAVSELVNAIRAIGDNKNYLDTTITQNLMKNYAQRSNGLRGNTAVHLTAREEEILRFTSRGFSNKKIAKHLHISVKTVETHRANAMRKLGINDRIDIVNYAIFRGWMKDN